MNKNLLLSATLVGVACSVCFSAVYTNNVFATDGGTTLSGAACAIPVSAEAYDIDFGTFLASDVYGQTKTNPGTKMAGGGGVIRTPTSGSGNADYYVYASNPCAKQEWVIQVDATPMTTMLSGASAISDASIYFSGADHVFRFNNSPANPQMIAFPRNHVDHSAARTVFSHGGINNGIGGDYGVLLIHEVVIPQNTPVAVYTGIFSVTCLAC